MAWQIPQDQAKQLDDLKSKARFKHRQNTVLCILTDVYMGKPWAVGEATGIGDDAEKAALADALTKATPNGRPLTPAEQHELLAKYREKFGDIDADEPAKPARSRKTKTKTSDAEQPQPAASDA